MAGGIFISYRRADSASFAGRIRDFFEYHYPDVRLFFDVTSIEPGEDFNVAIDEQLRSSDVVLAIIGERWVDIPGGDGRRRLDDPNDMVRLELSTALSMDSRVIPVLLDSARMPQASQLPDDLKPLATRNAEYIRETTFQRDVEHLAEFVHKYIKASTKIITAPPGREANSVVRTALVHAFTSYRDDAADDAFMICENPSGQFVQFLKDSDLIMLDLPSQALSPKQLIAAQRLLMENYHAECLDLDGESFAYTVTLPMEPAYLSYITLDVFEYVYGEVPEEPLKITVDR